MTTVKDQTLVRLDLYHQLGSPKTSKLLDIIESLTTCPFCEKKGMYNLKGFKALNGIKWGEDNLFIDAFFFRLQCSECKAEFIPPGVTEFGGFGLL